MMKFRASKIRGAACVPPSINFCTCEDFMIMRHGAPIFLDLFLRLLGAAKPAHGCEPREFTMGNGMQVLLMGSNAQKGRLPLVSLSISMEGEDFLKGKDLPYFAGNLVFDGSKKYPERRGFQNLLDTRGGSMHSKQTAALLNLSYSIDSSALHESLGRLADMFIAPLFPREAVAETLAAYKGEHMREYNYLFMKRAVLSSNSAGIPRDYYRQAVSREELGEFLHTKCTADKFSLVVVADEDRGKIQEAIEECFGGLPPPPKRPKQRLFRPSPKNEDKKTQKRYGRKYKSKLIRTNLAPFGERQGPSNLWISIPVDFPKSIEEKTVLEYIFNCLLDSARFSRNIAAATPHARSAFLCEMDLNREAVAVQDIAIELSPGGADHVEEVHFVVKEYLRHIMESKTWKKIYRDLYKAFANSFECNMKEYAPDVQIARELSKSRLWFPEESIKEYRSKVFYGPNVENMRETFERIMGAINDAGEWVSILDTAAPLGERAVNKGGLEYVVTDYKPLGDTAELQNLVGSMAL